tara:strand:- start:2710 stop:2970 length:261 start_codon:yes stop_codon:yes gene_type:complete
MTESECMKKLSELECGQKKFSEIFNELIKRWPQDNRESYLKAAKKIENIKFSQDEFIAKYKHLEILMYDPETFMPIYKGIKKWSEE